MDGVRFTDHRRVATLAREIYALTSLESIGERLVKDIGRLIPCDHAFFVSLDVRTRRNIFYAQSIGQLFDRYASILDRCSHETPFIPHFLRNPEVGAVCIRDLISPAAWARTEIYNEGWRHIGVHEQLAVDIPSGRPNVHGLYLNRHERNFVDRDKALLNLLRPHISEACAAARQWQRFQRASPFSDAAPSYGSMVLNSEGRPGLWDDAARRLLSRFCDPRHRGLSVLPEAVRAWADRQIATARGDDLVLCPRTPLDLRRGEALLSLRLVSAADASCHLLLIEERVRPSNNSKAFLRGLTARENEVLVWIARGKTNEEIGIILGMSVHTVKTHVKRILAQLGVETRTAAAAWAMEQMVRS